jgi:fatty acid desaturase
VCNRIRIEALLLLALYTTILVGFGPGTVLAQCGVGLLLALMFQDPLLLSQHTHMPRELSSGATVRPFTLREQEHYTRSVRFPVWFSWLIMHFDAHELHHIYPHVAGYHLRRIAYQPHNEVNWWLWWRAAKRLSGVEFLFGRRETSGFPY